MGLDTLSGCMKEIEDLNNSLHSFEHKWARSAGELRTLLRKRERAISVALLALKDSGLTVSEKMARAEIAIFEAPATKEIETRIDELEGMVEEYKTRFKTIDRLSSNAQTIAKSHMEMPRG